MEKIEKQELLKKLTDELYAKLVKYMQDLINKDILNKYDITLTNQEFAIFCMTLAGKYYASIFMNICTLVKKDDNALFEFLERNINFIFELIEQYKPQIKRN